jgi:hypothetical protein
VERGVLGKNKIRVLVVIISGYGILLAGPTFPALQNSVSSRGYLLLPCSFLYPLMTAMKFFQSQTQLPNLLSFAIFLLFLITAIAAEETGICKPSTWSATDLRRPKSTPTVWKRNRESLSVANIGKVQTGQINCRYPGGTYDDVDSNTCAQLANKYQITLEKFFMLNPELDPDCGNIEPRTDYCVAGCKYQNRQEYFICRRN